MKSSMSLEGSAMWAQFHVMLRNAPGASQKDLLSWLRQQSTVWSQDRGLVLFLLLDRFSPHWKKDFFGRELPPATEDLRQAIAKWGGTNWKVLVRKKKVSKESAIAKKTLFSFLFTTPLRYRNDSMIDWRDVSLVSSNIRLFGIERTLFPIQIKPPATVH